MPTAEIILLSVMALVVLITGIAGAVRGTYRSLLPVLGMLLGATLVVAWLPSWQNWIRATFEADPGLISWIVVATAFLAVFFILGYGGTLLLPRRLFPERLTWRDRLLGLLIGLVTGLLAVSYLLHYAAIVRPDTPIMALIDASLVAQVVWAWMPWFLLALVGVLGLIIVVRALLIIGRSRRKAPAPVAEPPAEQPRADAQAAATDDETFEPTPLPGTRPMPNDDEEVEQPAPAAAPAQDEPAAPEPMPAAAPQDEPAAPESPQPERDEDDIPRPDGGATPDTERDERDDQDERDERDDRDERDSSRPM